MLFKMSTDVDVETWRVCRACLTAAAPHSMVSVFHVHISKKLMALCGVQVWPADGLPKRICRDCIVKLDISFQFKRQCERADQRLRQLQNQHDQQIQQQSDFHHQLQTELQPPPLPLPPAPGTYKNKNYTYVFFLMFCVLVQSNELPLTDSVLTDLSHSVPTSLKNHSDLLAHTLLGGDLNHLDNLKTEKKGYQCKTCFKMFDTSTKLSRHVYVHTGQKPFKCEICKKAFSHNSNLKVVISIQNTIVVIYFLIVLNMS